MSVKILGGKCLLNNNNKRKLSINNHNNNNKKKIIRQWCCGMCCLTQVEEARPGTVALQPQHWRAHGKSCSCVPSTPALWPSTASSSSTVSSSTTPFSTVTSDEPAWVFAGPPVPSMAPHLAVQDASTEEDAQRTGTEDDYTMITEAGW